MSRMLARLQVLIDENKQPILLAVMALVAIYALIIILSMLNLTALTMVQLTGAQLLLLLSILLYIVLIITTRESIARQRLEAGGVVFQQGDMGKEVYVVVSGEAEVIREQPEGGQTVIGRVGPGEFFGEMALIQNAPRVATVRALTDLEVLVMQRGAFLSLFTHLPGLRRAFQLVVQQRVDELRAMERQRG